MLCVEAYCIYSGIMSHFLYLKIYTGMYNFMKEIQFSCEKSLLTLIYYVLELIRVGVSVTLLCN